MNKKNIQESSLNSTIKNQEIMEVRRKIWELIDQGRTDRAKLASSARVNNSTLRDFIDKVENPRVDGLFIGKLNTTIEKILRSSS